MSLLKTLRRILFGGPAARRQTAYRLRLKLRGIDLEGATISELGLDGSRSHEYADSGMLAGPIFRVISGGRAALDIGCGKGGAMLAMLPHFDRVDGIELSERLVAIARTNLRRHARRAQVFQGDATRFDGYANYDTFYLFNPFPADVLRTVVERISAANSAARIVYINPRFAAILTSMGYVETERIDFGHPVAVYQVAAASTACRISQVET